MCYGCSLCAAVLSNLELLRTLPSSGTFGFPLAVSPGRRYADIPDMRALRLYGCVPKGAQPYSPHSLRRATPLPHVYAFQRQVKGYFAGGIGHAGPV